MAAGITRREERSGAGCWLRAPPASCRMLVHTVGGFFHVVLRGSCPSLPVLSPSTAATELGG